MKFLTFDSFESHLREALIEHPSSSYGVIVADPAERRYVIDHIIKSGLEGEKETYLVSQTTVAKLLEAINSPTLFSTRRLLIYDGIDQLKGTMLDELASHIHNGMPPELTLILGGAPFSQQPSLYQKVKHELVMLDLSREKPWEQKERLLRWLICLARKKGKVLKAPVAKEWIENEKKCFLSLRNQLDQWIAFVGKNKDLSRASLEESGSQKRAQTGWELSEAVLFGKPVNQAHFALFSEEEWQGLMAKLRYQLRVGLCVALSDEKRDERQLKELFPKLRPKQLGKYRQLGTLLSKEHFLYGLQKLSECELYSRMGGDLSFLLTRFMLDLHGRKSVDT